MIWQAKKMPVICMLAAMLTVSICPVTGFVIDYNYPMDEEVIFECEQECCCKSECIHLPKPVFSTDIIANFTHNYEMMHHALKKFVNFNNQAVNRGPNKVLLRTIYEFTNILTEIVNTHREELENLEIAAPGLYDIVDMLAVYRFVNIFKTVLG